jgi:hypothetical protein
MKKKKRISFESYNCVMKGGENGEPASSGDKKYNLRNSEEFNEFCEFVKREFTSTNKNNEQYIKNYNTIKSDIYRLLTGLKSSIKYLPNNNIDRQDFPQIFYIYNNETHKIIFIGVIDGYKEINGKNYKNVNYLLRRPNTFGAGKIAVYHILEKLNIEYNGICLASLLSSKGFYDKLGFINYGGTLYLDKNEIETLRTESIEKTEFVSLFDKIY